MERPDSLDSELRGRLLALGIPEAEQSFESLLQLLPQPTRAAAKALDRRTVAELAIDLLAEGFAMPAGRERHQPELSLGHGVHACLFYRGIDELVALARRSFTSAVGRNELCLWATPRWLPPKEAARRLTEAAPDLAAPLAEGRIEVFAAGPCYLDRSGRLRDRGELLASWKAREQTALSQGFSAMLALGDTSDLPRLDDLDGYLAYEHAIAPAIRETRITGICAYSLLSCPTTVIGRILYPHACALIAVGRSWQAIMDPDRGREQLRAVLMSFIS